MEEPVPVIKFIKAKKKKERKSLQPTIQVLVSLVTAIVAVSGIILSYQTFLLTAEEKAAQREETQRNRFTHAVECLKDESLVIRLGALYELKAFAESDQMRAEIADVIVAFSQEQFHEEDRYYRYNTSRDILLASEIFCYLYRLDYTLFTNIFFYARQGDDLNEQGKFFIGIVLQNANLKGANLDGAHLRRRNLWDANLQGASLQRAQMESADLSRADLRDAILIEADLNGAILPWTNLRDAILIKASLYKAHLYEADLRGVNLFEARLDEAEVGHTNLQGADLTGAMMKGTYLAFSNLQEANLEGATLYRAALIFVDLRGARNLTVAQLLEAYIDRSTLLDDDLKNDPRIQAHVQACSQTDYVSWKAE